ncbi:hypothetical protein AB0O07_24470 [Streptomyces sp. NPDC093085]|uniref:hypothetical protein n=1 Tax=Streptomyces sp. NPDC093085 TaxID=3155068 RepID=UPI0034349EC0
MKLLRRGVAPLVTAVLTAGLLSAGAGSARAASVTFEASAGGGANRKYVQVVVVRNGKHVGYVYWNGDPDPVLGWPGNAMIVADTSTDTWGIEAYLNPVGRVATTRGHNAPYVSPWATGDLPEGRRYELRVCLVRGAASSCSGAYGVTT